MKKQQFSTYIKEFEFKTLFNELGWDYFGNTLPVAINETPFLLQGVAEKKGFVILLCPPLQSGKIPESSFRKQIERKVTTHYYEHLIIYIDGKQNHQIWQLTIKEENKPKQVHEVSWYNHQDTDVLFQRMKNLLFTLDEEEHITIVDVKQRISENFAKNTDKVTKKFYSEFKRQHTHFLDFIKGINDHIGNKENQNKQWYASLMLNRLMFCYFIQKKGFLDQDVHYLQNKLKACTKKVGKGNFYNFYRSFLLELFHDGLGKPQKRRKSDLPVDLGRIPYLNGGLFDVHELERQFSKINIADEAFQKIFNFFDQWNWHLDNSIEATGRDINPDVIGYIFEKYINDRAAMGAYYTKEDITEYIGKNTIIPFLFGETERKYQVAFKCDSEIWLFLKKSGDQYIYDSVKKGIPKSYDLFSDLPEELKEGFHPELENQIVNENVPIHLWEKRKTWNRQAPEGISLPSELYRELIERRKLYAQIKLKIESGDICHINDFITYNLNIRQFAQDFIECTKDPVFIRHFYKVIKEMTILDPTCGSGAFLFAALNILEPLYEACITRMEQFVAEQPGKHKFFEKTLVEVRDENHPNLQYFIYKNIVLNNLYGVDIMKEAVEIAKLRLFLKLVGTVDLNPRKNNYGLEPLPDIDFNIRAGNSLIGFITEQDLLKTISKKEGLFAQEKLNEFIEECELVNKAYLHFQNSQIINNQGENEFYEAKAKLNFRLKELNKNLNYYLASSYGIDRERFPNEFKKWKKSHQPFHWFAEFFNIININNGFDIIIGNPPYVVYSTKKFQYKVLDFKSIECKDLYGFTIERSLELSRKNGKSGMIVPISLTSTNGFSKLREIMMKSSDILYFSNFATRPGKLFDGVDKRLTIFISSLGKEAKLFSSKYYRWNTEARDSLFSLIKYVHIDKEVWHNSSIPKISSKLEHSLLEKIKTNNPISYNLNGSGKYNAFHTRKLRYFVQFLDCAPKIYEEDGSLRVTSELKILKFENNENKFVGISSFLSSLFFWYYIDYSDCRNVNKREVFSFPLNISKINELIKQNLKIRGEQLLKNLQANSNYQLVSYKKYGNLKLQVFQPSKSKPIIDDIDTALAQHYEFTEEELDYIINYDIKYRMGKELSAYLDGTLGLEDNGKST